MLATSYSSCPPRLVLVELNGFFRAQRRSVISPDTFCRPGRNHQRESESISAAWHDKRGGCALDYLHVSPLREPVQQPTTIGLRFRTAEQPFITIPNPVVVVVVVGACSVCRLSPLVYVCIYVVLSRTLSSPVWMDGWMDPQTCPIHRISIPSHSLPLSSSPLTSMFSLALFSMSSFRHSSS